MSIDRDTFENASENELASLSVPEHVLGFLAAHDDRAFEAREIASQTERDSGAVSTALSRLKDRGLVEHKATYWAVTDDEQRLQGYSGYERATALFNAQLGSEDEDAWRKQAPEAPHPSVDGEDDP
ncbi:MAG: MarR family transcriptional regulator [Haloarculaceae archaeon]